MRILVAEDDTATRLVLEAAVTSLGHDCVVAASGEEAWRLFETVDVEAVISDRMMPGMDGVELCRRIRACGRDTYTYFIFLTAFDKKADVLSGMEAGADDYLVKPLDIDDLKMRLFVASRVTSLHRQLSQQSAQLERLNRQLFDQSRTDPLTQLGSRLRLSEDLENIYARADRYGHICCAVMCDIDFFKAYNDSKGHLAGDEVLKAVSRALMNTARSGDQVYRYGGEEFLILLPEQSLDDGLVAAERYRQAIEQLAIPHDSNPPDNIVTISAGVASLSHSEGKSVEAWLNEADAALYGAKQLGRNRVLADGKPLAALDLHHIDPQEV
jgi:two-component system chemotaxis response regulator CheY